MKGFVTLFTLLIATSLNGQHLRIFDLESTDYPILNAKFYLTDEAGKFVQNIDKDDFSVTELGTAREILDISSSHPDFTVEPSSFSLKKGESIKLKISYTVNQEKYAYATFITESEPCSYSFFASAGIAGESREIHDLEIVSPNGGEVFLQGNDLPCTWKGVLPEDTISLSLSRDNGKTWDLLSASASDFEYIKKKMGGPPSDECLLKADIFSKDSVETEWQLNYGIINTIGGYDVIRTMDGGYLVSGVKMVSSPNVGHLVSSFWITKLNPAGMQEWVYEYSDEYCSGTVKAAQLLDGSFAIVSTTLSSFVGVPNYHSGQDIYLVRLDRDGNELLQRAIGNHGHDKAYDIEATSDGGYVICGYSNNRYGELADISYVYEKSNTFLAFKMDINNNIEWVRKIGAGSAGSVRQTKDGGYVIAGFTKKEDQAMSHEKKTGKIVKLDSKGNFISIHHFGGNDNDAGECIVQTDDEGFLIAGYTYSEDSGEVLGNHGNADMWIVKTDIEGTLEWQRCIGGSSKDKAYSCAQLQSGEYVIVGETESSDGDFAGISSGSLSNMALLILNQKGSITRKKVIGGDKWDKLHSVCATFDGGFIVSGRDMSQIGNRPGGNDAGIYVEKYLGRNNAASDTSDAVFSIKAPECKIGGDINMKECLIPGTKDSLIKSYIQNTGVFPCQIDTIFFRGENTVSFRLISPPGGYTIAPGEEKDIEIAFSPRWQGNNEIELVIKTQYERFTVKVYGTGVLPNLKIVNTFIDFGKSKLNVPKDSLKAVTITNTGNSKILISDIKQAGPNLSDFSILDGTDFDYLHPGDTVKLDLRFLPTMTGRTSGRIEFEYIGTGSPAVVELFGNGIGTPEIQSDTLHRPDLLCKDEEEIEVVFRNVGTDYLDIDDAIISGPDKVSFAIEPEYKPVRLYPEESDTVRIQYRPTGSGEHNAHLILTSPSYEPETYNLKLEGTKNSSSILLPDQVTIIQKQDVYPASGTFEIENTGTMPFGIDLPLSKGAFTVTEMTPNPIRAGQIGDATIICTAYEAGLYSDIIELTDLCERRQEFEVRCNLEYSVLTEITFGIPDLEADTKDFIFLPVVAENITARNPVEEANCSFDLHFNPTVLSPIREDFTWLDKSNAKIKIENIPFDFSEGDTVRKMLFRTALGNAESCALTMSNPEVTGGNADIVFKDGSFTLTNICNEGGTRLLDQNTEGGGITMISPNPASDKVTINLYLQEKGMTELTLRNLQGKVLRTLFSERVEAPREITIQCSITELGSGIYFLNFSSPGINMHRNIEIIR